MGYIRKTDKNHVFKKPTFQQGEKTQIRSLRTVMSAVKEIDMASTLISPRTVEGGRYFIPIVFINPTTTVTDL